jgi:hypothetical protein
MDLSSLHWKAAITEEYRTDGLTALRGVFWASRKAKNKNHRNFDNTNARARDDEPPFRRRGSSPLHFTAGLSCISQTPFMLGLTLGQGMVYV